MMDIPIKKEIRRRKCTRIGCNLRGTIMENVVQIDLVTHEFLVLEKIQKDTGSSPGKNLQQFPMTEIYEQNLLTQTIFTSIVTASISSIEIMHEICNI